MARKSTNNDTERPEKVGERVAKVIARAGFGSRREGEEMIAAGRVAINGTVIDTPAINVTPGDKVTIDGKPLPQRERTRLFLYHKPRGLVTSHNDPEGRPTVFAALPKHLPRLLSVGRLDFNTEGLLLLTNDGGLARILELPDTGWLRRYRVRAHGEVTQPDLDALRGGVTVEGMHYGPIEARLDRVQGSNAWITIGIREGKNREVRNVLSHLGLQVTRLIRVSFGPFQLGDLPEGEVEEIKTRVLQEQLGEDLAEQAGADFDGPIVERDEEPRREGRGQRRDESWPDHPAGRDERRGGERERGARDDRPPRREGRPDRGGDRRGPREDRGFGGRGRERDERRSGGDETVQFSSPESRKSRPKSGNVWRQQDEFSERPKRSGAFRGTRREDGTMERPAPTGEKTAGLIADRKGRRVLVERFSAPEPEKDEKVRIPKEPKRFGKGMRREHPADAARSRPSGPPRERSFGPRRERSEEGRGERSFRPRGERSAEGRAERSFRPRGERSEGGRGERPFKPRGERPEGGRSERSFGARRERSGEGRGERPFKPRGERPEGGRGERSFGPRRERSEQGGKRSFGDKREGKSFGPKREGRSSGPKRDGGFGAKRDRSGPPRGRPSGGHDRPSGGRPPRSGPRRPPRDR